ncbi:hypothetical protein [Pseudophaeobacter leonis]|uniref:hypothetical protein n=1 Tax=Pseudophaeobacter leonis TaxID=1144477 RepID=UPI0009F5662D|nr:hypothetical protein [Pseudophaeobacter leonis]
MHPFSRYPPRRGTGAFRRLAGCVTVLLFAVQLLLPSIGKAGAAETWIEICSEFGAIEILVQVTEGNAPSQDCPDCDICLMCAAQNGLSRSVARPVLSAVWITRVTAQGHPIETASNPAQFWHDGRGPPRLTPDTMTRACGAAMATTQGKEAVLWS